MFGQSSTSDSDVQTSDSEPNLFKSDQDGKNELIFLNYSIKKSFIAPQNATFTQSRDREQQVELVSLGFSKNQINKNCISLVCFCVCLWGQYEATFHFCISGCPVFVWRLPADHLQHLDSVASVKFSQFVGSLICMRFKLNSVHKMCMWVCLRLSVNIVCFISNERQ